MTEPAQSNLRGALYALLGMGLFSTHDAIVKTLGGGYSPFQIIFFSVLFAFPLATLMLMRDQTTGNLRPHHPWYSGLRTGAVVITGMSAFYAFSVLPLAQVYAFIFAAPLLITILSIPILGETVGRVRWIAVLIGLTGVLVVLRPGAEPFTLGHFAGLLAAVGSAVASVVVRKIGRDERSAVLLLYPMMANFVIMLCLMPLVYRPMPLPDMGLTAAISVLGFLAMNCMIAAYRAGTAAVVAPMQYSQIVWASIFGLMFFEEVPDTWTLVGIAIIIASGVVIVLRESFGGTSTETPVLRTRSRAETGTMPRVSAMIRARVSAVPPGHEALAKRTPKE